MMRRFTLLVALTAFIFSCGGHWYVLQGVAWVNMIRNYSEMVPFSEAVSMTLSGKYPCAICKAIAEKKSTEQQKSFSAEKLGKKFSLPVELRPIAITYSDMHYPDFISSIKSSNESPLVRPPRSALS